LTLHEGTGYLVRQSGIPPSVALRCRYRFANAPPVSVPRSLGRGVCFLGPSPIVFQIWNTKTHEESRLGRPVPAVYKLSQGSPDSLAPVLDFSYRATEPTTIHRSVPILEHYPITPCYVKGCEHIAS
jgi:hypothetical protein